LTSYPNSARRTLSDSHRRMLFEESGISPDVAEERGYYTARSRSEVPEAFKEYQRKPGLVVPMFSPDGETVAYQLRTDKPRKNGPKYETPGGISPVVDVHPRMLEEVCNGSGALLITEGAKTGDAATSRGIPTVVLAGVWMWCVPKVKPYRLKPCFDHIGLEGREVFVAFDSDCMSKASVQEALAALVAALKDRGASVKVIYLPDAEDGSKQGVDDYLAAGGTVREVFMLAREFDSADVGRIRMSRDETLRATFEDLEQRYWHFGREHGCKSDGGETSQDVFLQLIEDARRGGKVHRDGIRVQKAHGPLALEVGISSRTLVKCIQRLEEWGVLYRDNEGRKSKQAGHFVLRADVKHKGGATPSGERPSGSCDPCTLHPRSPRLMWSRAKWKPTKKMIRNHRLGKLSILPEPREGVRRLGKRRGHLFDTLDCAGGTLTLRELGEITGRRPRDLVRRRRTEKGRDGLLIWPIEAGIVQVDGEIVSLAPDWLQRIEIEREAGEEIEMWEIARHRYERKKRDYHERGGPEAIETESPPPLMGPERVERILEERSNEDTAARVERQREKVGNTAETFVFDRLKTLERIRLELLREVYADAGGDPGDVLPAAVRLGCRIERLIEYGNERFVFPPLEATA
jgi:hypothetical protein